MSEILEFGIKRENEERRDGGCSVVFDPESQRYAVYTNLKNDRWGLYGGGFDEGEDEMEGSLRELVEESGLFDFGYIEKIDKVITHYFNTNKEVNRVAHASCFLVILNSTKQRPPQLEEHEKFELTWVTDEDLLKKLESVNQEKDYDHWIYFINKAKGRLKELGHLIL